MTQLILSILIVVGPLAAAKDVKYKTKFENPVVDSRIAFEGCAIDGALYGVAKGEPGDVICWGKAAENGKTYYVFKAAERSTQDYFEQVAYKDLGGWSEDGSMGERESTVTLVDVKKDFTRVSPGHRTTLKYHTQWMYSEGNTMLRGKLPGSTRRIDAPVFSLGDIDQDLRDFVGEISH